MYLYLPRANSDFEAAILKVARKPRSLGRVVIVRQFFLTADLPEMEIPSCSGDSLY